MPHTVAGPLVAEAWPTACDLTYRQSFTGGHGRRGELRKSQRRLPRWQSLRRTLGQGTERLWLLNIQREVSENVS